MSGRRDDDKPEGEVAEVSEGWESLAEEGAAGNLAPSPELEEALREAAEAVDRVELLPKDEPAAPGDASASGDGAPAEPGEPAAELAATQDRLLRLQADFENFRRRALRERQEAQQYGHQNLVKELLTTVDNLARAIDQARGSGGGDLEGFLQGVELVHRELLGSLVKNGVAEVEADGKPFDPALHEAMAQKPDASLPLNTVVEVMQKGYQLRGRLLRPARVVVSSAPGEGGDGAEDEATD